MKSFNFPKPDKGRLFALCRVASVAVLLLLCAVSFFLPFAQCVASSRTDYYECVWDEGITQETYYTAYRSLEGIDEAGRIVLSREGKRGFILSESVVYAAQTLLKGSLGGLLSLDCSELGALERAALYSTFSNTLYFYEGLYFCFTGKRVEYTESKTAKTLAVLSGTVTRSVLSGSGAVSLRIYPDAFFEDGALAGARLREITAYSPYEVKDGALYFDTIVGRRLLYAFPEAETLAIEGNLFCDRGALLACDKLRELTLPFAGNAMNGHGEGYRGEVAHLFLKNGYYSVPPSLKKITVTGGRLVSRAFYACPYVEEVDACGVKGTIDEDAFADLPSLRKLHAPLKNAILPAGDFTARTLDCGCVLYERRMP